MNAQNQFKITRPRVAAILIENHQMAMIERQRSGKLFYVFPGGHVEPGETLEQALVREVKEELGLEVIVGGQVAEFTYKNRLHYYYQVSQLGGTFGSGTGKELARLPSDERGSVKPCWLPVDRLTDFLIYPVVMAELILRSYKQGWPDQVFRFVEPED